VKKKPIKLIKILKKLTSSIQFRFYKLKTKKTEPNPNRKEKKRVKTEKTKLKPSQTEKTESNRFELVFILKNQTKPNRNQLVPVLIRFRFFLKKINLVIFLNKNQTKQKITTSNFSSTTCT